MYKLLTLIILTCFSVTDYYAATALKKGGTTIQRTKEFNINGIMAWSEAKKNGFKFFPEDKLRDAIPDGTLVRGDSRLVSSPSQKCDTTAKIVGGVNILLEPCRGFSGSYNTFSYYHIFQGKRLKSGWKVKELKLIGTYQWTPQKWRSNSDSLHSRIKLTSSETSRIATKAMIKELILIGPINGRWQDAFDVM